MKPSPAMCRLYAGWMRMQRIRRRRSDKIATFFARRILAAGWTVVKPLDRT